MFRQKRKEVEEEEEEEWRRSGGGEASVDETPHPYTVTCSPGMDAESPVRENMLF